jgi:hypothetical protein
MWGEFVQWLLDDAWQYDGWRELEVRRQGAVHHPYREDSLVALANAYEAFTGGQQPWSEHLDTAIRTYPTHVLLPHLPQAWPKSGLRVGVYFREYPLPTFLGAQPPGGLLAADAGDAPFHQNVMVHSVAQVQAGNAAYQTLRAGIDAARRVIGSVAGGNVDDNASFIDQIVVSDWVKLFSLFAHENATPFPSKHAPNLSRQSVHASAMYRYAAPRFAEEVTAQLDLNFVVIFGPTNVSPAVAALTAQGWTELRATNGNGKPIVEAPPRIEFVQGQRYFIVLPHPGAMGDALNKALRFLEQADG